jgi:hypothetical protein
VAATTTAASPTTFTLRPGFVDNECAAEKILAIEGGDSLFSFCIVANFRETEAARLTRETIAKKRERIGLHTDFRKQRRDLLFCGLEREISNVEFLHGRSPCAPMQDKGTRARLKEQVRGRGGPARRAGCSRLKQGLQRLSGHDAATVAGSQRLDGRK